MDIGIITIHYGFNYGSVLQSYALTYYLNRHLYHNAEIINYIPRRYRFKRRYLTTKKTYSKTVKALYLILVVPQRIYTQHKFNTFLRRYVPLSRKVYNADDARKYFKHLDFAITGSDQVWNSDYNEGVDPMYYLSFVGKNTAKMSYSASCGKDEYTKEEWSLIDGYLRDFKNISLREKSSVCLFHEHGYKDVVNTLDPVFLLSKEEWVKIECRPRIIPNNYVLIYCLDSDESDMIRIAKQVSSKYRLKTAVVSYCHIWNRYDTHYVFRNQSPNQFLWLVNHADYIVTNSFHGIAFSIIMKKQFLAVRRRKYNNRLDCVLDIFGLKNRYISFDSDYIEKEPIDYDSIFSTNENILVSKKYLIDAIEKIDKE